MRPPIQHHQSGKNYQIVFENAPLGILVMDRKGKILDVNAACLEILGSPGYEATKTINAITFPRLVEAGVSGAIARCIAEGRPVRHNTRYTSIWGKESHLRIVLAPLFNDKGEVEGCQAIVEDVTDQQRAEEKLKQSHRRLEESQRIARIGTWEWNALTGETCWSDEVYRICGFEPGSIVPSYELTKQLIHPEDVEMWERDVQNSLASGRRFQSNLRILRKDGSLIWVHGEGEVLVNHDGEQKVIFGTIQDITERELLEKDLRQSEQTKSLILNNTREIFSYLDKDRTIVWANKAAADALNLTPELLVGKHCYEVWHGRTEPCGVCPVLVAIETGLPQYNEDRQTPDGRYWSLRINPIFDKSGDIQGATQLVLDITKRKKLEKELREKQQQQEILLETMDAQVWYLSGEDTYGAVNRAHAEFLGLRREQIEHKRLEDFLSREAAEVCKHSNHEVYRTKKTIYTEELLANASGEERLIAISKTPKFDDSGNIEYIVCVGTDVTEHKRAEEALHDGEQTLRGILSTSPVGIAMSQGRIIKWANDTWVKMFGFEKEEEYIGQSAMSLYPSQEEFERIGKELVSGLEIGNVNGTDAIFVRRDGAVFDGHIRMQLLDTPGDDRTIIAAVTDISHRKSLEAQLVQSQKMEAIGTLAAGIAHDFNNMLQVILGWADVLLLDKKKGQPGYYELQRIVETSKDARDLVQKIRIFSRRADIRQAPLNLNRNISEVIQLLGHTLPRNIRIDRHTAPDLAFIHADTGLMDQVVMNLAINASEAMPEGGILTIRTENTELDHEFCKRNLGSKPGAQVLLTVSDTGKGIPKDLLDRILDPFFSTKTMDYKRGTGLGLPVVQGIVALHKGYMTVESQVGQGTTFRIYLPAIERPRAKREAVSNWLRQGGSETILLVDDEESVRRLAGNILGESGYKVLAACDGQEALDVYEREQGNISLVILDIVMPGMDGEQCLKQILEKNSAARVLVATGLIQETRIQDVVDLGAKGLLRKPYPVVALLQKVREILDAG